MTTTDRKILTAIAALMALALALAVWGAANAAPDDEPVNVEIHAGQCASFVTDYGKLITVCLISGEEPTCRIFAYDGLNDGWYMNFRGEWPMPAGSVSAEDTTYPSFGCSTADEPFGLVIKSERKAVYRWVYIPAVMGGEE